MMAAMARFSVEEKVTVRASSTGEILMADWAIEADVTCARTRREALEALRTKIEEELA